MALFADANGTAPLQGSLPNAEAWRPGSVLQVGAARFCVAFNPPSINKVRQMQRSETLLRHACKYGWDT